MSDTTTQFEAAQLDELACLLAQCGPADLVVAHLRVDGSLMVIRWHDARSHFTPAQVAEARRNTLAVVRAQLAAAAPAETGEPAAPIAAHAITGEPVTPTPPRALEQSQPGAPAAGGDARS